MFFNIYFRYYLALYSDCTDLFSNPSRPGYDRAAPPPELTNLRARQ